MNERLELYKEILELEPHSRVFFAYAKLLEKEHRTEEALQALAKGLEYQPDFLEARLYYIDLLVKHDRLENANINLHKLTDVFQNYSGFWYTWSKLAANENMSISSALGLLATLFNNPSISFMQILQAGIQAYAPENATDHLLKATEISYASLIGADSAKKEPKLDPASSIQSILAATSSPEVEAEQNEPDLSHVLISNDNSPVEEYVFNETLSNISDEDSSNAITASVDNAFYDFDNSSAKTSTKTKSMANLLAEQGDVEGAIEIYTNLLQEAKAEGRADDEEFLSNKISSLQSLLEPEVVPAKKDEPNVSNDVLHLSPRMHSVLDRLADRLERRAKAS